MLDVTYAKGKDYRFVVHFDLSAYTVDCQIYDSAVSLTTPVFDSMDTTLYLFGVGLTPAAILEFKGGNLQTPQFQVDNIIVTDDSGTPVEDWILFD